MFFFILLLFTYVLCTHTETLKDFYSSMMFKIGKTNLLMLACYQRMCVCMSTLNPMKKPTCRESIAKFSGQILEWVQWNSLPVDIKPRFPAWRRSEPPRQNPGWVPISSQGTGIEPGSSALLSKSLWLAWRALILTVSNTELQLLISDLDNNSFSDGLFLFLIPSI